MRAMRSDERWLLVGSSGSGKSTYAKWLLQSMPIPTYVIDSKTDFLPDVPAIDLHAAIASLYDKKIKVLPRITRVVPAADELEDDETWDAFFAACLARREVAVYLDECYQVPTTKELRRALTAGRSLHVPILACTQRPAWVSRYFLSEASRIVMFRLADERDRKTLQAVVPGVDPKEVLARFHSVYYDAIEMQLERHAPLPINSAAKLEEIAKPAPPPPVAHVGFFPTKK
jgi:energy-coupling factor transporter ATP-binding protein EcfA2